MASHNVNITINRKSIKRAENAKYLEIDDLKNYLKL